MRSQDAEWLYISDMGLVGFSSILAFIPFTGFFGVLGFAALSVFFIVSGFAVATFLAGLGFGAGFFALATFFTVLAFRAGFFGGTGLGTSRCALSGH